MKDLKIKVYLNQHARDNEKVVFECIVTCVDGLLVPFDSLVRDFTFLFGSDCITVFEVV